VGNTAVSGLYQDEEKSCLRFLQKKTPPWTTHSWARTWEVGI